MSENGFLQVNVVSIAGYFVLINGGQKYPELGFI
jgi:hypothetical protein